MNKKIFRINKYLSEKKETIISLCDEAIENKCKLHFKAPVGSGKTTTIIDLIENYPDKQIIVLFPQISISEQVKTKLTNKGIEAEVVNAETFKIVIEAYDDQAGSVFLSTIDSAFKLIEELEMSKENTIVILDETHTFLQSARDNFTRSVETILTEGFPIIGFSATPSGWVNKFLFEMDDQVEIQFKTEQKKKIKQTTVEQGVLRTVAHEIATNHEGMTVVFMESKKRQEELSNRIKEYDPLLKVCYLNADTKTTTCEKVWKYLMRNDSLPDEHDVYIVNSIAQAGVNITNQDIDRVFLVDWFDPFGFAQYLGRCRNYDGEYYYYHAQCSKQLTAFDWKKIEERIDFIQNILQASDHQMQQILLNFLPLITDQIYEDKKLNLVPNKCKIAYSVYEELRNLSGEDLKLPVSELFPNIVFESTQPIEGIVVSSADSHAKRRRKAKAKLRDIIIDEHVLINALRNKMHYDYSEANMQHIIDTCFNSNGLAVLKAREDKLNEFLKLIKQSQTSPSWMFTINSLYRQSHKNARVLNELVRLSNNQVRCLTGALDFFRKTTKPRIKKLMSSVYTQYDEMLKAKEWKKLLKQEVNIAIKSPNLLDDLYKYCLQTGKSNSKLKLVKINETIVDYLEVYHFKHLTVFQGRLAPK